MTVVPDTLEDAALALADGRPCIFPTDTVYGVGVAVCAASGPDILFDVKQRDAGKPIAWLVGSIDDLQRYGKNLPSGVCQLAHRFWPGALTVIVEASDIVPASYRSESGTIGLRMPANETTLALIRRVGSPLATTSANISGRPVASTVIDCTVGGVRMVREGGIPFKDIAAQS